MLTRDELIAQYIADTAALHEQDRHELPDTAARAVALYGAKDAAAELLGRFNLDVVGHAGVKQ